MFNIPEEYTFDMSFENAAEIIANRSNGDLLKGMQSMNKLWDDYCMTDYSQSFDGDDDFYETFENEVNAYNVVFSNMRKLFI
jgi:hypothetical protein